MTDDARDTAWTMWRRQLAHIGGGNPLLHCDLQSPDLLDLSTCHPGGFAQFIARKPTRLSNLIRDDKAFRRAVPHARLIEQRAVELLEDRGIRAVRLATGFASWTAYGTHYCAPIFLQDVTLRAVGNDVEFRIVSDAEVNRQFVTALWTTLAIEIDAQRLMHEAWHHGVLNMELAERHIAEATRRAGVVIISDRVISTFASVAADLSKAATTRPHPVLDALADVPGARQRLEAGYRPVEPVSADRRSLQSDTLLFDAVPEQERVIAQIAAGDSLVVQTVPGCGRDTTIANAVSELVLRGKRVGVVAASRATLDGLKATFDNAGVSGLFVSPETLQHDVVKAITARERARQPFDEQVSEHLVDARTRLASYRHGLHRVQSLFGVSVHQTLGELARLTMHSTAPATTVRLHSDSVQRIANQRDAIAAQLKELAKLGEFQFGPNNSAWYGASFADPAQAKSAYVIARRMAEGDLQELVERVEDLTTRASITPPTTLRGVSKVVQLLLGVRDTLEHFTPSVFDRSLTDLIQATAPRKSEPNMSGGDRRRLRQLAKDYIRPGAHVNDLHVAIQNAERQRDAWRMIAIAHTPPNAPGGIGDVQILANAVISDVQELSTYLKGTKIGSDLLDTRIPELQTALQRLTDNADALNNLQQRSEIRQQLARLGLQPLLEDFATRHVSEIQVRDELELAWWQSVLELQLSGDGALLGADVDALRHLEDAFINLDSTHVNMQAEALEWELANRWRAGLADYPGEAEDLRTALKTKRLSAEHLAVNIMELSRVVAPVWCLSPYTIATTLPEDFIFDTLIVLDANQLSVTEAVLPIAHATQIVVVGDPALALPSEFVVGPTLSEDAPPLIHSVSDAAEQSANDIPPDAEPASPVVSAFDALSALLPMVMLTESHRPGGRELVALVNDAFYADEIKTVPAATEFLRQAAVEVQFVANGTGVPDPDTGLVEGVPAEVQRVLELVMGVAVWHPDDSLMVVTPSDTMARLVRAAVREEIAQKPHLAHYFRADAREPFVVLTTQQAATRTRDRAVFSVGYGRTPHGRVLTNFGPLTEAGGEHELAVALTRARKHLTIVSCVRAKDLPPERMSEGGRALARALDAHSISPLELNGPDMQPMLDDLSIRIERLGIKVYRHVVGGIPLVLVDGDAVMAVETDADYLKGSLRYALRLHPEELRRFGWRFQRVYTFALFRDPQQVAEELVASLLAPVRRSQHRHSADAATSTLDERAKEDRDEAWGDRAPESRDEQMIRNKPPHY